VKGVRVTILRCAITIVILAILVYCISPAKILAALAACDWRWLMGALVLMPPFLIVRVAKWYLLVRQTQRSVRLGMLIRGYLWGMAMGLVTPGRVGELARIWAGGLPTSTIGLFLLEKGLEITSIFGLFLLSFSSLELVPLWVLFVIFGLIAFSLTWWKRFMNLAVNLTHRIFGWPSSQKVKDFNWAISHLKIAGCGILSLLGQIIFCLQIYLVLNSMGERYEMQIIRFIPLVFLGNFLPITIGGIGLRETIAVLVLSKEGISAAVAISSVLIVSVADLFVPAVIGVALYVFSPISHSPCKAVTKQ
jgi:glycosyltransferase 2 family protein